MGRKDLSQKTFFDNVKNFSGICNGVLFHGKEVIKPEELEGTSTEYLYLDKGNVAQRYVDVAKRWKKKDLTIAIVAIEGQSEVDYRMVFRNMLLEALNYNHQWKRKKVRYKKKMGLSDSEFLSGVSKTDKFLPVVTIVIYLGEKEWDGATDLYEMLELDDELKPYISNYQLNLFDYHKYDSFEFFQGEERVLFEVLSCANNKDKMYQILKENGPIEQDTAMLLSELINVKEIQEYLVVDEEGKEKVDMCRAFEDFKEEGREEGICASVKLCQSFDATKQVTIEKIAQVFSLTKEDAEGKVALYW